MHYNRDVFVNQFPPVKWFIYHLISYRILNKGYMERPLRNDFWIMTIDAHLFAATMNWCMVFGSDGCNPTHWKNLSLNEQERLAQSFREGLFQEIGLDERRRQQYWKDMTEFRNKFVAHRELYFAPTPPEFDTALAIAYYYDRWVRKIISPDSFDEPPLQQFTKSLTDSVTPLVDRLLTVTQESFCGKSLLESEPSECQ